MFDLKVEQITFVARRAQVRSSRSRRLPRSHGCARRRRRAE